jgi:RNase P/RNase MRP subunit p30
MGRHVNLCACAASAEACRRLGWDGFCVAVDFGGDFKRLSETSRSLGEGALLGAVVRSDVAKNAKRAVEAADLVLVDGRLEDVCREASESWDVDIIMNPELNDGKDLLKQGSGGLDDKTAAFMAERGIGYLVNADNLIDSSGPRRAKLLGRIMQNLRLARKAGVPVAFGCGQASPLHVRRPRDLAALALVLGLPRDEAENAVSRIPSGFAKKALERKDPDMITAGLEVRSWGSQQPRGKRRHGWY